MRSSLNTVILTLLFGALSLPSVAFADGLTATGDVLPIGAGGKNILTITGSTEQADFSGAVTAAGGLSINGNNSVLYPNGNIVSNGYIEANGTYTAATNVGELNFVATGWDAGISSYDANDQKFYHLIGSYHGWDGYTPNSVYIAGYNAGDTLGAGSAKSISFGGWGYGSYPSAFVDLINHRLGIGTTTPQAALDVNGSVEINNGNIQIGSTTNPSTICLNGQCISQFPSGNNGGGAPGPQGPKGDAGVQGPIGPQGPSGAINISACHVVTASGGGTYMQGPMDNDMDNLYVYPVDARCAANEYALNGGGQAVSASTQGQAGKCANGNIPYYAWQHQTLIGQINYLNGVDPDLQGWSAELGACTKAWVTCCPKS